MKKILSFFKNFFRNIVADPVSTVSGIGKIAAGGAMVYANPTSIAGDVTAAGLITSGLVSLGTNHQTGEVNPVIAQVAEKEQEIVKTVQTIDPLAQKVIDAINQAGEAASTAAKIQAAAEAVNKITEGVKQG